MEIVKTYYKHYRYVDYLETSCKKAVKNGKLDWYIGGLSLDAKLYGYTFRTQPWRWYSKQKTWWTPTPRGGMTECHLVLSNGHELIGKAVCSQKDNFCYKTGRDLSLENAKALLDQHVRDVNDLANHIFNTLTENGE